MPDCGETGSGGEQIGGRGVVGLDEDKGNRLNLSLMITMRAELVNICVNRDVRSIMAEVVS